MNTLSGMGGVICITLRLFTSTPDTRALPRHPILLLRNDGTTGLALMRRHGRPTPVLEYLFQSRGHQEDEASRAGIVIPPFTPIFLGSNVLFHGD